jgi:DNA-directed RNA polymerase specialized sigma54-like protein
MNYKEQFEKETGQESFFVEEYDNGEKCISYNYDYTEWLLEQLEKRDKKLKKILEIIEERKDG